MSKTQPFPALRLTPEGREGGHDRVAAQELPELRLETRSGPLTLAVLMHTPGDDAALLRGWLLSEGALPWPFDLIERLSLRAERPVWAAGPLSPALLTSLPGRLLAQQPAFRATGGLHGAALFSASGELLSAAEDVGWHSAVDKVLGMNWGRLPLNADVLCVSSRAGFEIVQKAVTAGVAVVVSVGAPTSLAVETAQVFGLTLCAFTRDGRTTVYSGAERVDV